MKKNIPKKKMNLIITTYFHNTFILKTIRLNKINTITFRYKQPIFPILQNMLKISY